VSRLALTQWGALLALGAMTVVSCSSSGGVDTEGSASPSSAVATTTTTTTPVTTIAATTTSVASDDGGAIVFEFSSAASIEGWSNVDDTVMGGVSSSSTTWESGRLVFSGMVSLDNNGGFTSTQSPLDPTLGARFDGADALIVRAEGDGKTYVLQLRTETQRYIARFTTVAGATNDYPLPLSEFEPVTPFLDPAPDAAPLGPSAVAQAAVYLLDKQTGEFRLAIESITAA
jgi:hypothetical protein